MQIFFFFSPLQRLPAVLAKNGSLVFNLLALLRANQVNMALSRGHKKTTYVQFDPRTK